MIKTALYFMIGICLILLALLIRFSDKFGRLLSPGLVIFFASLPGAIIFTFLNLSLSKGPQGPPTEEAGVMGLINYIASNITPIIVPSLFQIYLISLLLGLILIAVSALGKIFLSTKTDLAK